MLLLFVARSICVHEKDRALFVCCFSSDRINDVHEGGEKNIHTHTHTQTRRLEALEFSWIEFGGRMRERLLVVLLVVIFICFGYVGRSDAFLEQTDPVHAREPLVIFDIFGAVLEITVAFGQIGLEKVANQILQVGREVRRELEFALHDLLVDLNRLIGVERWKALARHKRIARWRR